MAGLNKELIWCGAAAVVLVSGTAVFGRKMPQQDVLWLDANVGLNAGGLVAPIQQAGPTDQTEDGFTVAASGTTIGDTPAGEAIKQIEAGQWVKAIQAIESINGAEQGLVLDRRGVLRPLSAMKSVLIASMPEEGQRTFRQLNASAANAKLAEAQHSSDLDERGQALSEIVNDYALCDAAGQAAVALGDIRFAQGRFNEATDLYRFAAEHPSGTADDPALMARRLTALARSQRWQAFDTLAAYARFRHPDTTIQIAGQATPLQPFITQLAESRGEVPTQSDPALPSTLALPNADSLEYDRPLIDPDQLKLLRQLSVNHSLGTIFDQAIAPAVTTDGDRVFTLALGGVARLDPETGTELWRAGDTTKTIEAIQSRMYQIAQGYHQSLVVHGDMLLASIPDPNDISRSNLSAFDTNTGKQRWTLHRNIRRSNNAGVVGSPLVVDGLIYYVTFDSNRDLKLNVVTLDGDMHANALTLGKAAQDPNTSAPTDFSPRLTMGQSHLLVQTNNGALIAVDVNEMAIAWAFTQKLRPNSPNNQMRWRGYTTGYTMARHTGEVVARNGLVIAKDTRTNGIYAFREHDAALIWSAPTDPDATIVHSDNRHVYVLGEEFVAMDWHTGERVWWTPHPGKRSGTPVFTKDACLIAGSQRLCRVDLSTGKLTHYRDDLADAAALHIAGKQLIGVTPQRIIALPLP